MLLARLHHVTCVCSDAQCTIDFYRDRLGFTLLFQVSGLAFFDCGGVRLMLSKPETPQQDHRGSFLYFKVDDIHATHRTLCERQVTFVDEPHLVTKMKDHELWMTFFHDLDGNPLVLMSEVPLKGVADAASQTPT